MTPALAEMTRRLLGYVVKLPDGTRSPRTPKPVPVIGDAVDAWIGAPDGSCVCPVFATRKPKPAPVVAAEGLFACLVEAGGGRRFFREFRGKDLVEAGTRAEAEAIAGAPGTIGTSVVVRILPDGAHEAAIEAARGEERKRVLLELRGTLVQCCADFADDEAHAGGLAHAVRCLEDLIAEKKGQAK